MLSLRAFPVECNVKVISLSSQSLSTSYVRAMVLRRFLQLIYSSDKGKKEITNTTCQTLVKHFINKTMLKYTSYQFGNR